MENQHNPHYTDLRARANREGDAMARAFEQSHDAYGAGDGARAHELSEAGKRHQHEMERLNGEASAWIFASACRALRAPGRAQLTARAAQRTTRTASRARSTCTGCS
jgi:hypothetical protein